MTADTWFGPSQAAAMIVRPATEDDKYSRGVLGVLTGSARFPGAAVLGVEAAARSGAGMVRYLVPDETSRRLVLSRRPEAVTSEGRVQAWLVGSGTDRSDRTDEESAALARALDSGVPVVLDAGALDLVRSVRGPAVVTPHARELTRLRETAGLSRGSEPRGSTAQAAAAETARDLGVAVVLKGSVTHVATPSGWSAAIGPSSPWLASAGTGDVLGGILGAFVAGHAAHRHIGVEDLGPIAAAAVVVHARAGEIAADGAPLLALEVAEAIPSAIRQLLRAGA